MPSKHLASNLREYLCHRLGNSPSRFNRRHGTPMIQQDIHHDHMIYGDHQRASFLVRVHVRAQRASLTNTVAQYRSQAGIHHQPEDGVQAPAHAALQRRTMVASCCRTFQEA
jgi:hypothetical protein